MRMLENRLLSAGTKHNCQTHFSSSVEISAIASNVHIQYVEIQFYWALWFPLLRKPFTFKRIKHTDSFIIAREN